MADIVQRLRNPPFGTETSERNAMSAAADEIERLRAALGHAISAIRDAEKDTSWTSGDPYGESLADELERVLASVDTHPKGGDGEAAPFMSGAVPEGQTPYSPSDHPGERA